MAFKRPKNLSVRLRGNTSARYNDDVESCQGVLVKAEAFANQPFQTVARNRVLHMFFADSKTEPGPDPHIMACHDQETAIGGFQPTGILEGALESAGAG